MYITDRQVINGIGFMWDPKCMVYELQFTIEIGVLSPKDLKGIRTGTGMALLFKGEWKNFGRFAKKRHGIYPFTTLRMCNSTSSPLFSCSLLRFGAAGKSTILQIERCGGGGGGGVISDQCSVYMQSLMGLCEYWVVLACLTCTWHRAPLTSLSIFFPHR